ncbi:FkbM family methyltransferase [Taklimakanibacter deserti]|uniref:FkbM family methyltransferase n=1 Tax=Taklimakanibacter deserti TaxID=2267839 RepID=UPI000E649F97
MIAVAKRLLRPWVERIPTVARTYRSLRDRRDLHRPAHATPYGFRFVGNPMFVDGRYEPAETAKAQELFRKCDVFVNVGANQGYYCCLAGSHGVATIAIEPDPLNLQYLLTNITENRLEQRIEVFPLAASSEPGILRLYGTAAGASLVEGWSGSASANSKLVPVNTLDNIIGDRLSGRRCFVLIDIEGHEFPVLQGAQKLLDQQPRPVWIIEIQVHGHQPSGRVINPQLRSTFEMFWSRGYESWTVEDKPRPVLPDLIRRIESEGDDLLGVYNFLFA